jgi:hypothetical protein
MEQVWFHTFLQLKNYVLHSVVDPKLFFSDPYPIFRRILDQDPDPTWLVKSFGSSFGSDPKHSLFHNANDFKWLFIDFKANFSKKMLDYCIFNVIIIKLLIFLMIFSKIQVQFRIRIRIRIQTHELRIRILQKVSDPCGSRSGSTTLVLHLIFVCFFLRFLNTLFFFHIKLFKQSIEFVKIIGSTLTAPNITLFSISTGIHSLVNKRDSPDTDFDW